MMSTKMAIFETENSMNQYQGAERWKFNLRSRRPKTNKLPDFMVNQLLDIVHYIKIGIEFEFVPQTDNEFYRSQEFKNIVTESISSYQHGNTEDMDLSGE